VRGRQRIPIEERFPKKYIPEPNSGCWLWTEGVNACGYGTIGENGNSMLAHRVSYRLHRGKFPKKMRVLHTCDMPCCVNPEHLFLGTQRDNVLDMEQKGRAYHPNGEAHGLSKLTEANVRAIRLDPRSSPKIARDYGVTAFSIRSIRSGRTWSWLV